ncbi:hypothetical protein GGR54DRAFT_7206 [Hypoxylon sp. NC1633]|nr:hypothetical protein GGR54DRAFT_7206 [Hypoxylon sp. NC1633]
MMSGPRLNKQSTQKRLACDRCHARKLRCLRETFTNRCSRCVQDGYSCTYSPPLKCGRPKKASILGESISSHGSRGRNSPSGAPTPPSDLHSDNISSHFDHHLSELAQIEAASNSLYTTPHDADLLYHTGAASLTPSSPSLTDPTLVSDSSWLDSLIQDEHFDIHDQSLENSPEHSSREVNGCHNLESLGLGGPDPMILIDPNLDDSISDVVQTLCRLQQELIQIRRPSGSDNGEPNITSPSQTSMDPVDDVLRPGQELVDTIRRLFEECARDRRTDGRRRLLWDRQTLLPLVFTPLSLLLSTYGELLREVAALWPQGRHRVNQVDHDLPDISSSLAYPSSVRDHSEPQRQYNDKTFLPSPPPPSGSHRPSIISGYLNLSLGEMNLDRPLQLIIMTTVIKHHLTHLEHALHVYERHHVHGCDLSPTEGHLFSALAELRSYTRLLMSEASKIVLWQYPIEIPR